MANIGHLELNGPNQKALDVARRVLKMKHAGKDLKVALTDVQLMAREVVRFEEAVSRVEIFLTQLQQHQIDRPPPELPTGEN